MQFLKVQFIVLIWLYGTGGEDFIVQDQLLLTFDYSIRSYNATISIINDGIVESDETFTCNIQLYSREQNVMIFQSTAEIIIQDSDSKLRFGIVT